MNNSDIFIANKIMNYSKADLECREKVIVTQEEQYKKLYIIFPITNQRQIVLYEPIMNANRKPKLLFEEQEVFIHGKKK